MDLKLVLFYLAIYLATMAVWLEFFKPFRANTYVLRYHSSDIIHPYSHLLYKGSAHFSCLIHGEKVLKDISSSMKISLLWRFGLYALGLRFPIFPSQLISAFHSDTLSISATHKTAILLHTTSSLFCAEARNMNFLTVGLLEAIQSVFLGFFFCIPCVLPNQVPQQTISCKNTVKILVCLSRAIDSQASTLQGISDLDRFQGDCHYNESQ